MGARPAASNRLFAGLLLLIVVLGTAARWHALGQPLWVDELHTSWVVSGEWEQIPARAAWGNQSPLYFWIVAAVAEITGPSERALRLPSLLAGSLLIALAGWLARRLTRSSGLGLLAASLVALDRDCIFYAQEARVYALLQTTCLAHLAVLFRLVQQPTRILRCLFIAGIPLLIYLHYTAGLWVLAELLGAVVYQQRVGSAYRFRDLLADAAIAGLICIPAGLQIGRIGQRSELWAPYVQRPGLTALFAVFRAPGYLLLPLAAAALQAAWQRFQAWFRRSRAATHAVDERLEVPGVVAEPGQPAAQIDPGSFVLLAVVAGIPIALAWLITRMELAPVWLPRYFIGSLAALILMATRIVASLRPVAVQAIVALALIGLSVSSGNLIGNAVTHGQLVPDRREAWPQAVAWLSQRLERDQPVFLCASLVEDAQLSGASDRDPQRFEAVREFCRFPLRGLYRLEHPPARTIPLPTLQSPRLQPAQLRQWQEAKTAWWLIRGGPRLAESIRREAVAEARAAGLQAEVRQFRRFGLLEVVRIDIQDKQ